MKALTFALLFISHMSFAELNDWEVQQIIRNGGDINKIAVEKDPGPNAEVLFQKVHSKNILIEKDKYSFKWTELGYGAMTHKVIIPELAKHTTFNHRNNGEAGPCLASQKGQGLVMRDQLGRLLEWDFEQNIQTIVEEKIADKEISVIAEIKNKYLVNRAEGICKVSMVEEVSTDIDGEKFSHVYEKEMGYRFIDDCL